MDNNQKWDDADMFTPTIPALEVKLASGEIKNDCVYYINGEFVERYNNEYHVIEGVVGFRYHHFLVCLKQKG